MERSVYERVNRGLTQQHFISGLTAEQIKPCGAGVRTFHRRRTASVSQPTYDNGIQSSPFATTKFTNIAYGRTSAQTKQLCINLKQSEMSLERTAAPISFSLNKSAYVCEIENWTAKHVSFIF